MANTRQPKLRCPKDRIIQTLAYEAGGLLVIAPLYAIFLGSSSEEAISLFVALSFIALMWAPIYNIGFDWTEGRLAGRVASDRPHVWRAVHAAGHEATMVVLTVPVVMWLGSFGFWAAFAVDLGLTFAYMAYAYIFYLIFDYLRPIPMDGTTGSAATS